MNFDYDSAKDAIDIAKHGVSAFEAVISAAQRLKATNEPARSPEGVE